MTRCDWQKCAMVCHVAPVTRRACDPAKETLALLWQPPYNNSTLKRIQLI